MKSHIERVVGWQNRWTGGQKKSRHGIAFIACAIAALTSFAGLDYPAVTGTQVLESALVKNTTTAIDGFSDLDFIISGAVGVSNLDGRRLQEVKSQMLDGKRVVDLQYAGNDWIKGVRVVFSLDSGTVSVRYDKAYYYKATYGAGTYTYDDKDNAATAANFRDNTPSLYDGKDNANHYGIKELYLIAEMPADEYSAALPDGDVTIGSSRNLTLKGDAASGTIANNITISNATLTIYATAGVEYSGTISGADGTINITTAVAVASEVLSGEENEFPLVNSMCSEHAKPEMEGHGMQGMYNNMHMYAIAASGYDLGDLASVKVSSCSFKPADAQNETTFCVQDALGPVYQYQVLTADSHIRCVFFRLVQTAENDILAYSLRCCEFDAAREDVAFGEDLTDVTADTENMAYHIYGLLLVFERTAVPVVAALTGVNACTNCAIVVTEGSRARIVATEALPMKGSIEAKENSRLTLALGTIPDNAGSYSGEICSLTVRRGAVVTTRGRTGMRGSGSKILVEGGLIHFMGNHQYIWDEGDYIPRIELKDGGCITGYSPRGNASTALYVTGAGCSTNDAGVMLGISSDTGVYPVVVDDTTGDSGVDLEFSGPISAHQQAKNGGIAKQGAGTMRLTSRYVSTDPWMRLDEGTLVLGRSGMWTGERLVVKGGTLSVEDGVTGNRAASLDLQGSANLALGAGATLDLGDCTSVEWADGAKLTVALGEDSLLYGDVTDAQLAKLMTDDGGKLMRGAGRRLKIAPDKGFIVIFR